MRSIEKGGLHRSNKKKESTWPNGALPQERAKCGFPTLRQPARRYALFHSHRAHHLVPGGEKECEGVAEALNLLRRRQSPWTTLDRVSFGILGLTHTEREAVYEAVIDATRTRPEKAKRV